MTVSKQLEPLFSPLKIGDITIKNRITMAALTRNRAENTYPTDLMKEHFVQRADAGLIVTDAILVTRLGWIIFPPFRAAVNHVLSPCFRSTEWPNAPGLWDDKHVVEWKKIVDAVHDAGTKIYAQLWHGTHFHQLGAARSRFISDPCP